VLLWVSTANVFGSCPHVQNPKSLVSHPANHISFFLSSLPPLSHENEAMFGMACAMEAAVSLREHPELQGFSIGLTSGVIYNGTIGTTSRLEHTVLGSTVNDAARLSMYKEKKKNPFPRKKKKKKESLLKENSNGFHFFFFLFFFF
jgi:hypothetical protein